MEGVVFVCVTISLVGTVSLASQASSLHGDLLLVRFKAHQGHNTDVQKLTSYNSIYHGRWMWGQGLISIRTHKSIIITVTSTTFFIRSCELDSKSMKWLHSYQ